MLQLTRVDGCRMHEDKLSNYLQRLAWLVAALRSRTWTWIRNRVVRFCLKHHKDTPSAVTKRAFKRMRSALLINFPLLLQRPVDSTRNQDCEWTINADGTRIAFSDTRLDREAQPILTTSDCDGRSRADVNGANCTLYANPVLSRLVEP